MGGVSFLLAQMDEGSHSGLPYEDTSKRTVGPATAPALVRSAGHCAGQFRSRGGLPYLMSA